MERLAQDPVLSVRAEATHPVLVLFNSHLEQVLDIADALFATSAIKIHLSNHANELLLYSISRAGPRFSRHLNRALEVDGPIAVRAGHIWANAYLNDRLPQACIADVTDLPILARRGATETMATAPHLAPGELVRLFEDGDPDVRKARRRSVPCTPGARLCLDH